MTQNDPRLIAAGAALAVAVMLFGTTVVGAVTAGDVEPAAALPAPAAPAGETDPRDAISLATVEEAVAVDPFSADRTPSDPYRLPSDVEPVEEAPPEPPPPPPPAPAFKLVGTTETGQGGVALIQIDSNTPKVMSTGDTYEGYTLERIARTSATMTQGDRVLELQLQQPGMRPAAPAGRRGATPNRNTPNSAAAQRAQQQMEQRMQEMQERLRQAQEEQATRTVRDTSARSQRDQR